jgi:hypothetical protein
MTHELREGLVKFMYDTPAYGAILLTKMANPEPHFYNLGEEWLYHHGWSLILVYRIYRMILDIHKGYQEKVLWHNELGELVQMSGYNKLLLQLKKLLLWK